jgi:exopolyphosphatase / guanosine-5'-triphosphate,3'-diphosphate pyrophosphatase
LIEHERVRLPCGLGPAEMKFAAIDIGSNAIRLLIEEVVESEGQHHIEKVSLTRVPVRLGEDVFTTGVISLRKINQLSRTMRAFWHLLDVHGVYFLRAVGTSALREAVNGEQVVDIIKNESNIHIEIISGSEEADLIFSNYFAYENGKNRDYLFIDVGGGSTELTVIRDGKRTDSASFRLGTVRSLVSGYPTGEWEACEKWIKDRKLKSLGLTGIGTGGNINRIFKESRRKLKEPLPLKQVKDIYDLIKSLPFEKRITQMGMRPDRADVIVPACEIYLHVMKHAGVEQIVVPKVGLSDGIVLKLYAEWRERSGLTHVELRSF